MVNHQWWILVVVPVRVSSSSAFCWQCALPALVDAGHPSRPPRRTATVKTPASKDDVAILLIMCDINGCFALVGSLDTMDLGLVPPAELVALSLPTLPVQPELPGIACAAGCPSRRSPHGRCSSTCSDYVVEILQPDPEPPASGLGPAAGTASGSAGAGRATLTPPRCFCTLVSSMAHAPTTCSTSPDCYY